MGKTENGRDIGQGGELAGHEPGSFKSGWIFRTGTEERPKVNEGSYFWRQNRTRNTTEKGLGKTAQDVLFGRGGEKGQVFRP